MEIKVKCTQILCQLDNSTSDKNPIAINYRKNTKRIDNIGKTLETKLKMK